MKKRLLIHNGSISIGGQEKMLVEFLKALSPEKYEILLLVEQNIGDEKSYIEEIPEWIRYSFLTSQNFSRSLEKSRHSKNPLKRAWYSFLLREKKRRATREIQKYLDFSDIIIDYNMGLLRNLHKLNLEGKREEKMKVTVVGSHLCEDTRNALAILKEKNIEVEFFNLSEDLSALKKYLQYRETEAMYEEVRKNGGIGIPLLVLEDGTKTFDVNEILNRLG